MQVVIQYKPSFHVILPITSHSRWSYKHREICQSCRDAYEDEMLEVTALGAGDE